VTWHEERALPFDRRTLLAAFAFIVLSAASAAADDLPSRIDPPLADPTPTALAKSGPLGDMSMGDDKAPVTLIAYLSLTSPLSAHFYDAVLPELKTRYIATKKLRLVLREFPFDPRDTTGFVMARCVGKDKFFPAIETLFAKQAEWSGRKATKTLQDVLKPFGVTEKSFADCLANEKLFDHVKAVKAEAAHFNVHATPAFFVNGKRLVGDQSADTLAKAIEAAVPK
jgi:protein-disulfide isomerase